MRLLRHILTALAVLALCGCTDPFGGAPSAYGWPLEPLPFRIVAPPSESKQDTDLREAMVREVMLRRKLAKIWFIDFNEKPDDYLSKRGTVYDPPDSFMVRFKDSKVPVLKISKAWRKNWGITDSTGKLQGWVIHTRIIRWVSPGVAEVEYGSFHGLEASKVRRGTARLKEGKWIFEPGEMWIS